MIDQEDLHRVVRTALEEDLRYGPDATVQVSRFPGRPAGPPSPAPPHTHEGRDGRRLAPCARREARDPVRLPPYALLAEEFLWPVAASLLHRQADNAAPHS